VTKDRDELYGLHLRGTDRPMPFVNPYRKTGELNEIELFKLERHPLEIADAIIDTYSKEGPAGIAKVPGEVERLKWAGIYPQKQGGDNFMMRVKVPGGFLTAAQAREIGVAADAFGEGPDGTESRMFGSRYADLTTRQTVQIHWLRIEDIPRIWRRFAAVGLTTVQACGDSARNVLCCPVSGVDAAEAFDALPIARAVSDFFTGNREYANLPRKFKMSVSGCVEDCAQAEINDIGLWPARAVDGSLGFNLLVGGGLSDGERMASDIDVFVAQDQAVEVTRAIAQLFGELGNRENRGLARMRYLVQELGPEGFRDELAKRARFDLVPAGEELTRRYRGDHVGVHRQKEDGYFYVGCSVPVGRMQGMELVEAARLADAYGDGTLRVGTDQNITSPVSTVTRSTRCSPRTCWPSTPRTPGRSAVASWPAPAPSSAATPSSRPRSGP
jgi:ferredoxin-nitrite reductase